MVKCFMGFHEEMKTQEDYACSRGAGAPAAGAVFPLLCSAASVRLTVWRKSLLFHGNGYTVFDDAGRIVFRVDNYAHDWRQEAVLMDFSGNVLLTIRRCRQKMLNIKESWEASKGDEDASRLITQRRPLLRATKDLGNPSCRISINICDYSKGVIEPYSYRMSWSKNKEYSKIYVAAANSTIVAEIDRKYDSAGRTLFGKDVFSLRVQPGMDQAMVMAMIMITNSMK